MSSPPPPGIIRRNSLGSGGSISGGSQDKPSRGVTFAADLSRIVSGRGPHGGLNMVVSLWWSHTDHIVPIGWNHHSTYSATFGCGLSVALTLQNGGPGRTGPSSDLNVFLLLHSDTVWANRNGLPPEEELHHLQATLRSGFTSLHCSPLRVPRTSFLLAPGRINWTLAESASNSDSQQPTRLPLKLV